MRYRKRGMAMQKLADSKQFLHDVWWLTKSYWQSEEKRKAYFLLGVIVALTLGVVYMLVLLNQWNNAFYDALQNYNKEVIIHELIHFTWLAFLYIILAVYAFYLQQVLIINWRRWLTNRYIDEWLKNKTYYRMAMFSSSTDNRDQRISEDVRMFVEYTLKFGIGILKALTTFLSFVYILFVLSGPLDFTAAGIQFHIPGYMVWVALIYAVLGTWITYKVGNKLVSLNYVQQRYEADFRFSMMRLRENAESVAFYAGEGHEGGIFKNRFKLLLENFWQIITKQKQLIWINSGYSQIAIIFPFVVAMPRFLARQITLGGLMQISSAFGRVQESLSYFVDMYSSIAEWQAVVNRLTGFAKHMYAVEAQEPQKDLRRRVGTDNALNAQEMEIDLPDGRVLLEHMNFELKPGPAVLIKGASGSGKSTLLRALAGIWPYVKGELAMPEADRVMFIPQRPYLPLGTLKEALLYPGTQTRTDVELQELMTKCAIGYLFEKLYTEADWSHVLSVGEQQRLAFVRALIYQPVWLFLDEASSALDEATEAAVYLLIKEQCRGTTMVSVGHRSTLDKYHEKILFLDKENHTLSEIQA